jgi:hypothetical protein
MAIKRVVEGLDKLMGNTYGFVDMVDGLMKLAEEEAYAAGEDGLHKKYMKRVAQALRTCRDKI